MTAETAAATATGVPGADVTNGMASFSATAAALQPALASYGLRLGQREALDALGAKQWHMLVSGAEAQGGHDRCVVL